MPVAPDARTLREVGLEAGLDAVEITTADPFTETLTDIRTRKAEGLHGGMRFTYLKPERSTSPALALPDARALVVAAKGYFAPEPAPDTPGPHGRVARYAWQDHYQQLREGLKAVGAALKAQGWRARVLADDNALVDRAAAHRAGIGWWGKNANLLLPGHGSWYVLGAVVTDAPLVPTEQKVEDRCGTCTRCLVACPTGAIPEPGVIDSRRCLSWLLQDTGSFPREHRVALGDRIYGCDECQEVCPPNRRATPVELEPGARAHIPLLDLLDEDDDIVLAAAGRWYIPNREVRYVRRNALVVLGNVASPADERVAAALRRHLRHPDPLLRSHAVWAARRLGREDLLSDLSADPDPEVQAELSASVPPRP